MSTPFDYVRQPEAIYRRSFELVRAATDLQAVPTVLHEAAIRIVHACAMPDVVDALAWREDVTGATRNALERGAPVLADCEMVVQGVIRGRLPADNEVRCTLNDAGVAEAARASGNTRSACAVERWLEQLDGAVVVIGNAPTALFRLLELLLDGAPRPAAILAFPVGFVGAAESKEALIEHGSLAPYLTVRGRRGGSAMAAAALNALAVGEVERSTPGAPTAPR